MIGLNYTHCPQAKSWVEGSQGHSDFPIQNLPFGIFSAPGTERPRGGVAIGDYILDMAGVAQLLPAAVAKIALQADAASLNALFALGNDAMRTLRLALFDLLADAKNEGSVRPYLHAAADCAMHLPFTIGDYTDFYTGIHHAENIGRQFRPENPLLPNYKHVPIGYHGRASSIVLSGTEVRRPKGQQSPPDSDPKAGPTFGPCKMLDYELEVGFFVGAGNLLGDPVTIAISTAGTSPVLARRLRMRVEAAIPPAFGRLAAFAGALRARVARAIPDASRRRLFWEGVFDGQVASLVLAGRENEAGRALDRALLGIRAGAGHVSFIDVGSGDPDLLTLKALRRLQEADVLVCDFQFDPRVLDLARRDAERIRSAPGSISAWLVELARAGKQVVCLTDIVERGDEHKALADANITFETVPSVARTAEPVPVRARG